MLDLDDDLVNCDNPGSAPAIDDELQIIDCEQNTREWEDARRGIATASCFHLVIKKGRAEQSSLQRRKYMLKLLGERLTGELAENANTPNFERGHRMEDEAVRDYEFRQRVTAERVGFMRRGNVGYSPDRVITGKAGLVEIKSKQPDLQLAAILDAVLPTEHRPQVQGGLWVSGYDYCDFVSYWPGLPLFVKRIYRDEAYIEWLAAEVARFNTELDALEQQLLDRYYCGVRAA